MKPKLPGAVLGPLREALASDPNVVRAWWGAEALIVALEDVDSDIEDYKRYVQELSATLLPVVGRYGVSLRCGPAEASFPSASRGVLIYERAPA
jgi:hypothetical protein